VAIALDGGIPESGSDGLAGHPALSRLDSAAARHSASSSGLINPYDGLNGLSNDSEFPRQIAPAESAGGPGPQSVSKVPAAEFDLGLIKESFAYVMAASPDSMDYFYERVFATSPDTRTLFQMSMSAQHVRMLAAMTQVIWSLDSEAACTELLERLGRDHRKFGVTERHYGAFFDALRDTVRYFIGPDWRPEVAAAWQGALEYISAVMRAAAAADAAQAPPWWIAEIVTHELRSPGVAVLKLAPSQPLPYQAGQYVPVQVTRWPRVWRPFSIANAPRAGGLISLHVKAVPGGLVSNSLVHHSVIGDAVLLGAAAGEMSLAENDRDLLCVAGGTGLAPVKAIVEQAIAAAPAGRPRKITLFVGARQQFDLYDLEDLQLLESAYPLLRVIPVLSDEPGYGGLTGMLPDAVHANAGNMFSGAEAYVCGPPQMVSRATALLAASIPSAQIHYDPQP
jgi:NAD(P)H-flavin reductase/hemoglobin-like flavoprotein